MKKKVLIGLVVTIALLMAGTLAAWAYVDDVVSVVGTFGAPTGSYSDPSVAEPLVTGPPNQTFIQISDDSIVTLHLDSPIAVDSNLLTSDLIIDTYDQPYPAAAKIEVSADGETWAEVTGRALNDCNSTRSYVYDDVCPGLPPGDPTPSTACQAHVDLTKTGLSQVSYVRMTDYPGSIDGENTYPLLGFDLDAMYEGHQGFLDCDPITGVDIDIKPGSDPNCFNINGHGVIPVAINGSADFDVRDVDVFTLEFGGLAVRVKGNGAPQCSVQDWNGDTYLDLVCQFVDDADAWTPGDATATLTGELLDGTLIGGTGDICIRP